MRVIGASEKIAERQRRQDELLEARHERCGIARNQAVDQVEAGDMRRFSKEHVEPAERRRRPAEQIVEHVNQDQAGEEHRQRHAGCRDDTAGLIDQRVRLGRRQNAERHRDHDRDNEPEQGQLRGRRQSVAQLGRDRLSGGERRAEIAMGEIDHIAAELLDQRLVEAKIDPHLLDSLGRCGGAGEIDRRIAGQRSSQQEGDDHDANQAWDRHRQPLEDHRQHFASFAMWSSWPGPSQPSTSRSPHAGRKRGCPAHRRTKRWCTSSGYCRA